MRLFVLHIKGAKSDGFSLIEVLIVMVIVALLATLAMPLYGVLRMKAASAACMSNLRTISLGLHGYLQDHNMVWPQMPPEGIEGETARSKWWEETLTPYGVGHKYWICPSDTIGMKDDEKPENFTSSYVLTQFDEIPDSAFRWSQPWAVERGGFHGGANVGPNMLMPDGTIRQGASFPK